MVSTFDPIFYRWVRSKDTAANTEIRDPAQRQKQSERSSNTEGLLTLIVENNSLAYACQGFESKCDENNFPPVS